jgi:UDP-N-acetylglucosamine 2-epimerase (non-hydrolysing)
MKVLTITGTRPELIRLAIILRKLDDECEHIHVYTNQNYDPNLSTIFLRDLKIRKPDYTLPQSDSFIGSAFVEFEEILKKEKPDKVLVLGDTNSGLLAVLAAKKGIPVYHMEAGNRCYDGAVPEETNRRVIDACSLYNLPYTENSKQNLVNEGFHKNYIFKTGNPIKEVLDYYDDQISGSNILEKLGLITLEYGLLPYALLTFHRTENVDNPERVKSVLGAMKKVLKHIPVIYPLHPRSRDQFKKQGIDLGGITYIDPAGFFDFVKLEKYASVVFTDSGTVPEETSLFHVPTIVLRNTTERQELMENGSLILAGTKKKDILNAYYSLGGLCQEWPELPDYNKINVSDTVVRLLMGQRDFITRKGHDEY